MVGGLWAELPAWQDIQFGRHDWTLGDLLIAGEDQASIRDNIQSCVDRFDLADAMRFNTDVTRASRERDAIALREIQSSALREPGELAGRDVVVVGGGASAYDLLVCFENEARSVNSVAGWRVELSSGDTVEADALIWGTGYEIDLRFFANEALARIRRHDDLTAQCGCGLRALAEPNLYFMTVGLESTGTAPSWAYALLARTLMAHIRGQATLELVPLACKINHFHYPAFLAARDRVNFPQGQWEDLYGRLGTAHPVDQPLPIPD